MTLVLSLWRGVIKKRSSMMPIVEAVAARRRLPVGDLLGPVNTFAFAHARHEAWWEIRRQTTHSYPVIGKIFGRDHTTVRAGCIAHEARLALRRLAA